MVNLRLRISLSIAASNLPQSAGTAHVPWPSDSAPIRHSSRHTATRCHGIECSTRYIFSLSVSGERERQRYSSSL